MTSYSIIVCSIVLVMSVSNSVASIGRTRANPLRSVVEADGQRTMMHVDSNEKYVLHCPVNSVAGTDKIWLDNTTSMIDRNSPYVFVDPDSLPIYVCRLPRDKNQSVSMRLSSLVNAKHLIAALGCLPEIPSLGIISVTSRVLDSALSVATFDSLVFLDLYITDSFELPRNISRFPTIEYLRAYSPTFHNAPGLLLQFPCSVLTELPNLKMFSYPVVNSSLDCGCLQSSRAVEWLQWELPANHHLDDAFVSTGVFLPSSCIYDVIGSDGRFFDRYIRVMPALGQRSYTLHHGDSVRSAIAPGVLDRFITTLYAYVVSGERVFGDIPSDAHERFIAYAMNPAIGCDVEIKPGSIVLYNSIIYTGPLVPLMNNLLNEGCF